MKLKWSAILIFNILAWSWNIYQYNTVFRPIFENIRYNNDVEVNSDVIFPNPIDLGIQYDFCGEVTNTSDLVAQLNAGTPVPYQPVPISTSIVESENITPTPVPTLPSQISIVPSTPFEIPTPKPDLVRKLLEVVNVGNYQEDNYHIVFVPIGYDDAYILGEMPELIWNIGTNFSQIKVDFAYVNSNFEYDFKHVQQAVEFNEESSKRELIDEIKKHYPVDGVVVLLNTPTFLGTRTGSFAILSGSGPDTKRIATHEIGHFLSLDDGYQFVFGEDYLPNSELFYIDEMPLKLIKALEKLEEWPIIFKVGNCQGEAVYSFYESNNNVMRDYLPSETRSWGTSTFTPLQTIMMNDYVLWFKGSN